MGDNIKCSMQVIFNLSSPFIFNEYDVNTSSKKLRAIKQNYWSKRDKPSKMLTLLDQFKEICLFGLSWDTSKIGLNNPFKRYWETTKINFTKVAHFSLSQERENTYATPIWWLIFHQIETQNVWSAILCTVGFSHSNMVFSIV